MRKLFKTMTILSVLITFLALPVIGFAEEYTTGEEVKKEKKKTVELEEVVVTATRTETDVDSAPASVTVISKEDMKFRDIHTIDDALKFESGIYKGQLRGLSSSKTLVMLNGMPLNSGWFGGIRWDNIATENVQSVEIIRGPSSALYGGNAMGGVINIITSAPKKFEAKIEAGYGSDETVRYSFHIGDRFMDKLSLRLGYESEETDGYPTRLVQRSISSSSGSGTLTGGYGMLSRSGKRKWVAGNEGERYEERWNVNLNAAYDLTDTGSLALDFQMGHREHGYDHPHTYLQDASGNQAFSGSVDVGNGENISVSPSNYIKSGIRVIKTPSYMLTYRELFGSVGFTGKVGYQHEDMWYTSPKAKGSDNYENAPGIVREFDTDVWFSDLQTNIPVGDSHLLTSGFYFRCNDFDQGEF
ncbi:MAG: TonB-dependent receptor plug domain-containing protein, partial [Deltaproteobacteria bacterium]|nr:TonB-dependent receptor plug domain-containing protein [Deltaproteobacteria bacterium]